MLLFQPQPKHYKSGTKLHEPLPKPPSGGFFYEGPMKTAIIVTSAVAAGAVGGGTAAPIDWQNITGAIIALGLIVTNVLAYLKSAAADKRSAAAERQSASSEKASQEAKAQAVETAKAVDGKMTDVVKLVRKSSRDAATLAEKAKQSEKDESGATHEVASSKTLRKKVKTPPEAKK